MSLGGYLRRLVVGEQRCKVIIEVPDLGVDGWRRLAVRAMAQLSAAGLHGEVLGAAADEPGVEPVEPESVWPASDDVLIFGPADQDELDRRFALVTGAWSVPEGDAAASAGGVVGVSVVAWSDMPPPRSGSWAHLGQCLLI
jgi:hypothetical protein